MSIKTYLSRQYRLLGITSNDLFTDEETEQLNRIGDIGRKLDEEGLNREERRKLTEEKKEECARLKELFARYPKGKPRVINPKRVCKTKDGEFANVISLDRLKDDRIIQEFESELSRKIGIETNTFCYVKVNMAWDEKHGELLHQAFVNGIDMDIETPEGVETIHLKYFTASAGQMRTDRASFLEENTMNEVWPELFAGLTPEIINAKGGINLNKISAYIGLSSGASERWIINNDNYDDYFDIDNVIVVKDIESLVTCMMDHIDTQYNIDRGEHAEMVNQCDGVGWMLPSTAMKSDPPCLNFMLRGPKQSWALYKKYG